MEDRLVAVPLLQRPETTVLLSRLLRELPAPPATLRPDGGFDRPAKLPDQTRNVVRPFPGHDDTCCELDCLRGRLPTAVLQWAAHRAEGIGTGADRVLIAAGIIGEDAYLRAFADHHGIEFQPLDALRRECCPIDDDRLIESLAAGLLPVQDGDGLSWVVTPRELAARRLGALLEARPGLRELMRLAPASELRAFVARHADDALGRRATTGLAQRYPGLSAAPRAERTGKFLPWAFALAAAFGAAALAPGMIASTVDALLAAVFLAWTGLRLLGALAGTRPVGAGMPDGDDRLPVYTVIAALYREAASLPGLLAAIRGLAYPAEKLDVILVLEADDLETHAAAERLRHVMPFSVVVAPPAGPRTKPKALNAALPFARGTFTVIYDAEDRPEPAQLRHALEAFRTGGETLACVQCALTIDNTDDGWLTRLFTAEYANQFDVFLPGLSALGLPLPLGGSSNHFRTAALRSLCGWDAYNVTEDADLGMRLVRFGYRATAIDSTTFEEAPARPGVWLRQRTRWFKGWMQTWLVHMRKPADLLRRLGPGGFAVFQLVVGGNVVAALIHPLFLAHLLWTVFGGLPLFDMAGAVAAALTALHATALISGYLVAAITGLVGLARRRLLATGWVLLTIPIYWMLLSAAAWRALWQLVRDPYRWEKTAHGLARTSRRAGTTPLTDSAADPRQPLAQIA